MGERKEERTSEAASPSGAAQTEAVQVEDRRGSLPHVERSAVSRLSRASSALTLLDRYPGDPSHEMETDCYLLLALLNRDTALCRRHFHAEDFHGVFIQNITVWFGNRKRRIEGESTQNIETGTRSLRVDVDLELVIQIGFELVRILDICQAKAQAKASVRLRRISPRPSRATYNLSRRRCIGGSC